MLVAVSTMINRFRIWLQTNAPEMSEAMSPREAAMNVASTTSR